MAARLQWAPLNLARNALPNYNNVLYSRIQTIRDPKTISRGWGDCCTYAIDCSFVLLLIIRLILLSREPDFNWLLFCPTHSHHVNPSPHRNLPGTDTISPPRALSIVSVEPFRVSMQHLPTSFRPSVYMSVCLSIRPCVCLSACLSSCVSVSLPVCLSAWLPACLSVCLSACHFPSLPVCRGVVANQLL